MIIPCISRVDSHRPHHPACPDATMTVVPCSSAAIPWPTSLSTARLVLRPVEAADVPAISRLWADPQARRYLGGPVAPDEVARRMRGFEHSPGNFVVVSRTDGTVLGLVTVIPDSDRAAGQRCPTGSCPNT